MLNAILGLIVAGFCTKHIFAIGTRLVLGLIARASGSALSAGVALGNKADSAAANSLLNGTVTLPFKKAPTTAAMAQFVVNVEDFGKVVFGSEQELITTMAAKAVEAIAEKVATQAGKDEVAKRLADQSQQKNG